MAYRKYFKSDQKLLVTLPKAEGQKHQEVLTMYFADGTAKVLNLKLPYRFKKGEEYQFTEDMPLSLSTESMGVGIKITATFVKYLNQDMLQVKPLGTLEVFKRRAYPRVNVKLGVKYVRGSGTLRSFQAQWAKNIKVLEKGVPPSLADLPQQQLNVSAGGIRFSVKAPVQMADLFLVLLDVEDNLPPICTLAEAAWIGEVDGKNLHQVGMQFINVLESDQKRLDRFVEINAHAIEEDE